MINALLASGITLILGYLTVVKPNVKEWGNPERGFKTIEKDWSRIFLISYIVAALAGAVIWLNTEYNTYAAFITITIFTLILVAAWSDAHVYKVPLQLSNLTIGIAFAFMVAIMATANVDQLPRLSGEFLPYVPLENFWTFSGICALIALVTFLGFIRIKSNLLSILCLWFSFSAVFLIGYALLSGLSRLEVSTEWAIVLDALLTTYVFLSVVALFDLFLSSGIGGADIKMFYALGFGFAFWLTAYNLFVALLVGFALQLLLHMVAKPLSIGYPRQVKNSPLRQSFLKTKQKVKKLRNKTLTLEPLPTHHTAQAVPFVPALVYGFISTVLVLVSIT